MAGIKGMYHHARQEPCILKETLKKFLNDAIFSIKYPCVYTLLSTCVHQIRLLKLWGELKEQ